LIHQHVSLAAGLEVSGIENAAETLNATVTVTANGVLLFIGIFSMIVCVVFPATSVKLLVTNIQ
jgi:hypothetical protein